MECAEFQLGTLSWLGYTNGKPMSDVANEIISTFNVDWTVFAVQLVPMLLAFGLFVLAARSILIRGKGWEVPVWLLLAFILPVVFPILALIHFRKSKQRDATTVVAVSR